MSTWHIKDDFESDFGHHNFCGKFSEYRWDEYRVVKLTKKQKSLLESVEKMLEEIILPDPHENYGHADILLSKACPIPMWKDNDYLKPCTVPGERCCFVEGFGVLETLRDLLEADYLEIGNTIAVGP